MCTSYSQRSRKTQSDRWLKLNIKLSWPGVGCIGVCVCVCVDVCVINSNTERRQSKWELCQGFHYVQTKSLPKVSFLVSRSTWEGDSGLADRYTGLENSEIGHQLLCRCDPNSQLTSQSTTGYISFHMVRYTQHCAFIFNLYPIHLFFLGLCLAGLVIQTWAAWSWTWVRQMAGSFTESLHKAFKGPLILEFGIRRCSNENSVLGLIFVTVLLSQHQNIQMHLNTNVNKK